MFTRTTLCDIYEKYEKAGCALKALEKSWQNKSEESCLMVIALQLELEGSRFKPH